MHLLWLKYPLKEKLKETDKQIGEIEMEYLLIYTIGGLIYGALELAWRGWTHWTMLLCGGLCFLLMYQISALGLPLVRKCVLCAAAITTVEFLTGCLVNLRLGWGVWDYSAMPFNLLGQICPQFLLIWLGLSLPGLWLCRVLRGLFQ